MPRAPCPALRLGIDCRSCQLLLGELGGKGCSGNSITRNMLAADGKRWEAPRVWSRRDSIQASWDVNTKHT